MFQRDDGTCNTPLICLRGEDATSSYEVSTGKKLSLCDVVEEAGAQRRNRGEKMLWKNLVLHSSVLGNSRSLFFLRSASLENPERVTFARTGYCANRGASRLSRLGACPIIDREVEEGYLNVFLL